MLKNCVIGKLLLTLWRGNTNRNIMFFIEPLSIGAIVVILILLWYLYFTRSGRRLSGHRRSTDRSFMVSPEPTSDGDKYIYDIPEDKGGGCLKVRRYSDNNEIVFFRRNGNIKYEAELRNRAIGESQTVCESNVWYLGFKAGKVFKFWAQSEGKDVGFGLWDSLFVWS